MTRRMTPRACLACGLHVDAVTAVAREGKYKDEPKPSPGAFTLCIGCGHLMVFAEDMSLRNPTAAELVEAGRSDVVGVTTMAISHKIRELDKKKRQ